MANPFDDLIQDRQAVSPNPFDDILPSGSDSSALSAFGRSALRSAIPTAAGIGAGAGGFALGAALAPETGGLSLAIPIATSLLGGLGGQALGSFAQERTLQALAPEQQQRLNAAQTVDIQQHPVASYLGQLAPQALALRPSLSAPLSLKALGGALGAGTEAVGELARQEPINPTRIALSGTAGALLNRPTGIGRMLGLPSPEVPALPTQPESVVPEQPQAPLPSLTTQPEIPSGPIQEPRLSVPTTEQIVTATEKLIRRNPADLIATAETPRLFKRIGQALREGRINADDIPSIKQAGITTDEAANLFEQAGTYSGQTLNRLSQVWREIQRSAPEVARQVSDEPQPQTMWGRIAIAADTFQRKAIGVWQASLVSRLGTAVRNFASFTERNLFQIIDDAAAGTVEAVTGKRPVGQAFGPALEDLFAIGRSLKPGNRERVLNLLEQADPLLKAKLLGTPVNDVALSSKYANLLNTFNRTQEYFARVMVTDATIAGELRRLGIEPTGPKDIPPEVLGKAVNRALELTYASPVKTKVGRDLIQLMNRYPLTKALTYPFPRFMAQSMRTIYEFSPLSITKALSPTYLEVLRSGDPRAAVSVINKAAIGSALFAMGYWLRGSEYAGEKWYELKVDGKTVDTRPFGPLLPVYLFIGQALRDPSQFELRDWIEGTLGINRMAGTTLFLTSVLAGKNPDTLKRKLAEFAGEFLGGYSIPAVTAKDVLAQFQPEEAIVRSTKEAPLTGKFLSNIPVLSRRLPAMPSLTRSGPVRQEAPLLREFPGITIRSKTFLEGELDRFGLGTFDLAPKTGEPMINRLISERIGRGAERLGALLQRSTTYQQLPDDDKRELLSEAYRRLRAASKSVTLAQQADQVVGVIHQRLMGKSREQQRQTLESFKRKGLMRDAVARALQRSQFRRSP